MQALKVLEQYLVTFDLPDDHKHSKYIEAGQALKDRGCTVFRDHRHYDIGSDSLKMTVVGYVIELV